MVKEEKQWQNYGMYMIEIKNKDFEHKPIIEKEIFDEYVRRYKTEKGILLKRVYYGILAKK